MNENIAVITSDFPAPGHPSYIFVEQLVNAMVDLGVHVNVIAPQSVTRHFLRGVPKMPKVTKTQTPGGNEYTVYRPQFVSSGNCPAMIERCVNYVRTREIIKILEKIKPDVLYCHFWDNAMSLYKYANKHRLPLFVACGEGDEALEMLNTSLTTKQRSELYKAVNGVISVSSENKRKCIEYGLVDKNNVEVFPNCVNTDLFKPSQNPELKKKLGIYDDEFTVAFVGGFIHRKGAKRVADAITSLSNPKIKSIFIGKPFAGDSELPDCKGIVFEGSLDHDEIAAYLNCADVFVLPTLKEGCCNAIVEALATGLPVISSNGTFNDDIIDETNSIRVNPLDVEAIAAAIKRIKEDIGFRNSLKKNIAACQTQYSIIGRAERILNFINRKLNPMK